MNNPHGAVKRGGGLVALTVRAGGGLNSVSGKDESDPRKLRSSRDPAPGDAKARPRPKKAAKDVSHALRTVYDDTVREPIPDDLHNLLDKLR